MLNNERDLVTRLLKQNIVTLCKETVSYDTQLEIDGIICISTGNESQQIVVKVHNFFQKLGNKSPTPRKHTEQSQQSPNDHVWKTNTEAKRYPIGQFNVQKDQNEIWQKQLQKYKNDIKLQSETNGGIVDNNNDATSNGYDENHVEHNSQTVSPQIPKTITSLEQDETSFQGENDKGISNESSSGSDTMDYEDNAMNDDVVNGANDNLSNPHIISFHENGDVISEMPGQSPVKMSPTDVQTSFIDMKSPRKHSSRDENSMIECKLGKNCNTDEDLSKVPIRQVRDIQCKRCGTILSDGQSFEQHNTDVHSVYTCRVCFNTFTCRNNMKRHMRLHTGFRPYTCKLCSESFTRKDDIKRHLIRHSFDKPFRCNVCRKGYMDRKTVKNHIRKEHHSKIIHICQTCGEAFDNSVKFQDHKKNHPELKMFQCSLCKFTGSNLLTYNKHQLIHEIKKDYCCEPCDLKFGDPFRYTTHLRKHRSDPNFISYRCCFCNLKLSSYDLFMRHEHSHDQSKQFTCFVCMKQFQNDASLKEHKRSHPTYNCGNETPPPSLLPNVIASRLMAQQPIFPSFMSSYSSQGILHEAPDQPIDATVAATTLELVKTEFPKPETKNDIESMEQSFQPTQSTENNDYWCAECQHGFATEEHLTEHIVLAHEGSVLDNDAEVRNATDGSSKTDKQNEFDKIPKSELFEMSDYDESCDELENMEIHENISRSGSPSGIRYTPVPIFSNSRLSKRSKARQESKAEGDCNIQPESIDFKDERSSDSAGVPLLDTGDNSSSPKTDEYYENIKGDKNFHAQTHFSCSICFLSFSDFEPYDLHSSMVHRKYICHFCGKDFTSRPNRDRHVRYHTGEKPFKCDVCHQSFVRGDDLRYHRTSKHPDVKPYTCTICGLSFPWTKDLERHAKTHGINDDECKAGIHNCPGQCINTEGSYLCNCTGIPGYLPGENRPCKDLNECEVDNGGCEDVCINTRSSYRCRCKQKGYIVSADRHNCSDRDECQRYGKKICHNGHCVNIPGSFYCECNIGYRFHKPSKQCIDTNECKDNNGGCEDECVNTIGSFYCVCNHPGLQDENGTCIDINECEVDTDGCEDICINSKGSYHCFCEKYGYIIHSNGRNCTTCKPTEYMIDEKKLCVPCHPNSHAKDFNSSSYYDCECNKGFVGSPLDIVLCEDIDECATGELVCEYGCENTAGSAHCICPDGYSVHNVSACIDTNECAENGTICGGLCRNFDGYYECLCDVGYRMANDSYTCDDIDECSEGYNCSHRCINTIGGVQCSCYEGYDFVSDNTSCTDINECEMEDGMKCEGQCINLEGSFKCECSSPGLKLSWDGVSCSDINECQEGVNFCDDICINTHGSYDCKCDMTGYVLAADGRGCEDFNECLSPITNDCQQICNNYESSYNCSCPPGYIQTSDTNCEACPVGSYHDTEKDTCIRCPIWSTTSGKGTPSMAGCDCIDGYVGNISMAIPCKDKNECEEEDNFGCEQQCQNMEGYAYCSCRRGYNLHKNKKNCTDLDECKYQNHFCADLCENSIGSYSCSCRKGFELYTDRKYCVDINECYGDGKPCDEHCENTWGSYRCGCLTQGLVLAPDGHTCIKNRPKFSCPEDVLVQIKDGAIEVKVELPSDIFSNDLDVDPGWIKRVSQFPLGETVVMVTSLYTNSDGDPEIMCSFSVTVDHV